MTPEPPPSALRYVSFGSGSDGNCAYLGSAERGILLDAGVGSRKLRKMLRAVGLDIPQVMAVFLTHDHFDHIRAVGTLGEVFHIPVYAPRAVLDGVNANYGVKRKLLTSARPLEVGSSVDVAGFSVTPFSLPHDASQCVGYRISTPRFTFALATDVGVLDAATLPYLSAADLLVLESNYDPAMLRTCGYPPELRQRISGGTGHLSNPQCADALAAILTSHMPRHVRLCHLSRHSNTPELALQTLLDHPVIRDAVARGMSLSPLPRTEMSPVLWL